MHRASALVAIGLFVGLAALLALACGGGSDSQARNGPNEATPSGTDLNATQTADFHNAAASPGPTERQREDDDDDDDDAQDTVRDIRASGQRLLNLPRRLRTDVESATGTNTPTEDGETQDWFTECCEGAADDLYEELADIDDEAQSLIASYQGAGRDADALVATRVAGEAANARAALDALANAPDPEAALPLLDAVDAAVGALNEAIDALSACCA